MSEFRFVLTQRCIYKCYFCHKEGIKCERKELLTAEDIASIFKVGKKKFGVTSATLTGGEPLCRKDIIQISKLLYENGCDTTITTNGYLLDSYFELGKYISTLNISLHSLNSIIYENIVGIKNTFQTVINNLESFHKVYPDLKICLNIPVVEGINDSQIDFETVMEYSKKLHASLKFIELYPSDVEGYVSKDNICEVLTALSCEPQSNSFRTINFRHKDQKIRVTRIFCAAASDAQDPKKYCNKNNDLFILPDGQIKICRESDEEINLLNAVKIKNSNDIYNCIQDAFFRLGQKCILTEDV